eukprot:159325_1
MDDFVPYYHLTTESDELLGEHKSYHYNDENKNNNNNNEYKMQNKLKILGIEDKYIHRSLKVYEKHYGFKYKIEIILEIIYRLQVKDKLKKQKKRQNIFNSRDDAFEILLSMNFSSNDIKKAL